MGGIIDVSSRSHGALEPVLKAGEGTSLSEDLDVGTVTLDLTFLLESVEIGFGDWGETILSGDEDLLSTWELELGSSEGFFGFWDVLLGNSDGHEYLTNGDSC